MSLLFQLDGLIVLHGPYCGPNLFPPKDMPKFQSLVSVNVTIWKKYLHRSNTNALTSVLIGRGNLDADMNRQKKRKPSTSQGERSQRKLSCLQLDLKTSRAQNCETIHFGCLSHWEC